MKRGCIFLAIFALSLVTPLCAQELPSLPDDPRVKTGKLANGLSYIIVKNNAQKGKATFCVAEKAGTVLEKEGSQGSFMLLQMLAMQGSRHFNGNALEEYLNQLEVPRESVNFSTGRDRITYTIKDMPVERTATVDSALLILYNWMSAINVDEDDLDKVKPILHNKIIHGWDAEARLNYQELKELYPKSPYINALMPENIANLDKMTSKELRSVYYTWCRPGLQCVIVVGDIDLAKLETQIKSLFSTIPKSSSLETRKYYTPTIPKKVKAVLVTDKEYNKTKISINILKEPLKKTYRNSNLPFIQEYMDEAITKLLLERVREGAAKEHIPVYEVNIEKGKFLGLERTSSYTISFETLPNYVYAALAFFSGEIDKMGRYGFSSQEFRNSVEIYWRQLETMYATRASLSNDVYLQRAINHYFEGYSLASTELKFEIMKEVLFALSLSDLNSYAKALLEQTGNVVISCKMPDVEGITPLTKERILSSYANAIGKAPSHYHDLPTVEWPNVTPITASSIVSEEEDEATGAHIIKLSNGAKIVFKTTEDSKDTIAFKAVSAGGFSQMDAVNIGNQEFFNRILNIGGLGELTEANLTRLYNYNHLNLSATLKQNTEELNGYALASSVEKLLQAAYLSFTQRRRDEPMFEQYKQGMAYNIMYHAVSPLGILQDSVYYYNNSNKAFVAPITVAEVEGYDYNKLCSQFDERFGDASDFTFIFAGKDVIDYKDLIIKYIGGIKGGRSDKEHWQTVANYISKGVTRKRFMVNMTVPRSYVSLVMSCGSDMNVKNSILSDMTQRYLENFAAKRLYKEVTNAYVKGSLEYYPESIFMVSSLFETDSLSSGGVEATVTKALSAAGNIDDATFKGLVRDLSESYEYNAGHNGYWLNSLALKYIANKDIITDYKKSLDAITKEEFGEFVSALLQGNRTCIIMDGTLTDIPTARLWQEDEFIRKFFDIR